MPTRILFLRQDRIGDAIVSSGILRAISSVSPDLMIDVVASPANAPILRRDPSVSEVHVFDKRAPGSFRQLARRMRARRYDAVVDCMVTAPSMTGLILMVASGARHRIGIAGRGVDAALTVPVESPAGSEHIIDRMRAFVLPFGVDPHSTDFRPSMTIRDEERAAAEARWDAARASGPRVLVNVSAGRPDRMWPEANFAAAIAGLRLRFEHLRIAVIGGPADRDRVERVAAASGAMALPTPRIDDAIALVATADLVFTPDTSVAHMASAFAVSALVMYPHPEGAAQWGLYRSPGTHIVAHAPQLAHLPLQRVLPVLERLVGPLHP